MLARVLSALRRSPAIAAVAAAVLTASVAGSGFALAAGGGGDTFFACALATGKVRQTTIKVNVKPTCPEGQNLVSWNQIGPAGPQGPAGPPGPGGELHVEQRVHHEVVGAGHHSVTSMCEEDEVVTGGGVTVGSIGFNDKIFGSGPDGNGWNGQIFVDHEFPMDVWVTAMCASIGEPLL